MSLIIKHALQQWNELESAEPGSPLGAIRFDITRALQAVDLTARERAVLMALYFSEPLPIRRDKRNKIGTTSGRPRGGRTQLSLITPNGRTANALQIELSRTIATTCAKLADYLGTDYLD
jgi:hypothetical protein